MMWKGMMLQVLMVLLIMRGTVSASSDPAETAREECRKKIAACTMDASANLPVCGSDGVTYPNHCRLISKQCLGMSILIKHTGPCPETPPCFSARLTARPGARPMCRPDGTYAPVQCHSETGYCWCVTAQGRPLPNTSVRGERPRCHRAITEALRNNNNKKNRHEEGVDDRDDDGNEDNISGTELRAQRRRSPNWKQKRQYSNNRHRANCDRSDKARFNGNLIENFKIEYRRTNMSNDDDVEKVLSWKFTSLDKNSDGFLDRAEYKELRRLAKKAVRPKKCARTFARTCDLDRDLKLSRQEWGACLSNDFTRDFAVRLAVPQTHRVRDKEFVLKGNPSPIHTRPSFNDDPPEPTDDTDANDCLSDRNSVLEDQRQNSQEKFYIPECTPDGRYHKVQCYSGYCWCVYQDTGKPIPGTSSKDQTPNCNPVPAPVRPMKGCPEAKKQIFLRDLMDLMQKKMKASSTDSDEATEKWQASKEERVATWHFVMLDKNKNKVLERKEWKSFRAMVANNRQLRRCGKKLPRYCDINNDRRISMTEWLSCLNAQRPTTGESSSTERASTSKPRRIGPNPLDQLLLNDDD